MLAKLVLFVLLCLAVYALFRGGKRIWFFPLIGVIFSIENNKKKGMY